MATKLKNLRLTSVDLVRAGANQEADICLYKNLDGALAENSPQKGEPMNTNTNTGMEQLQKSIKMFDGLTMAAENREKLYRYHDALMQSLYSILEDSDCEENRKMQYLTDTLEQYATAMKELFPQLINKDLKNPDVGPQQDEKQNPEIAAPISKTNPNRYDHIIEVEDSNNA